MEHTIQKQYNLETVCSKNAVRVLRCLFRRPYMAMGITEIAGGVGISRSNVYRAVREIQNSGLIVQVKTGRKKLFRIDSSSRAASLFFALFSVERYNRLPARVKNLLDRLVKECPCKAMVLFGSFAQGLYGKYSDIDLCLVEDVEEARHRMKRWAKSFYPEFRFELHFYKEKDFREMMDFVVLDSLLNGIAVTGLDFIFQQASRIQTFSKTYLLYRLHQCEAYLKKLNKVSGPARRYFQELITVSLGEIHALIKVKTTVPKKRIKNFRFSGEIERLHEELSKKGDRVWLI